MSESVAGSSYTDQFARMARFLERVRNHNRSSEDYDDDLWAFFQNAWHLRDWAKNDDAIDHSLRHAIAGRAQKTFELQVCADLACRAKHFSLTRKTKHGFGSTPTRRDATVGLGHNVSIRSTHYIELSNGDTLIAQELAEEVVLVWRNLLEPLGNNL